MKQSLGAKIFRYVLLLCFALMWAIPIYITLITPFKTTREIFTQVLAWPTSFSWNNYLRVFQEVDLLKYLSNSVIVTGFTLLLLALVGSLAAYAIYRTHSRPTKKAYLLFSLGLMIPTQAAMIALFNVVKGLGLYNTKVGLILAFTGACLPVSVFLFTGFFKSSVPFEVVESAYIDGCSEIGIYSQIVAPLSASAFGTVIIYNCITVWKDFTYPLIFTQGEAAKTLPIAIYSLKGQYVSDYPMIFAGVVIASLPLLAVYIALQRQFIAGMTAGAVKG